MGENSVVFVGGCMRSGTTLVQRILSAGKDVNPLIAECQYLNSLVSSYRQCLDGFDLFGADYFGDVATYHAFNRKVLRDFLEMVRRKFQNPVHLVLKRPELTFHFSALAHLLPEARFVLVIRDPRDTISSMLEVARRHEERSVPSPLSELGRNMERLSSLLLRYYQDPYAHPEHLTGRLMTVRYEDIVTDGRQTLAALERFTGISLSESGLAAPDPKIVSGAWQSIQSDAAYSGAFWSANWMGPVNADSIGRHRQSLTSAEIAAIERCCDGLGRKFRYW